MGRFFYFMLRTLFWILILSAGYYGLLKFPGTIDIQILQTHIKFTLANGYLLSIFAFFVLYSIGYIIKNLLELPLRINRFFKSLKHSGNDGVCWRALRALTQQDYESLHTYSQILAKNPSFKQWAIFFEIESLIQDLNTLNIQKVQKLCAELMGHEPAKDYALYGLMQCALVQQDDNRLVFLGEKISKDSLSPKEITTLIKAYGRLGQGPNVFKYFNLLNKKGGIAPLSVLLDVAQNLNTLGHISDAVDLLEQGFHKAKANDPDFIAFTLFYAHVLKDMRGSKKALSIIEQAWAQHPNGDLWQIYMDLRDCQSPEEEFKATQRLASFAPDHLDSRYYVIKAAISANLLGYASHEMQEVRRLGGGTDGAWKDLDITLGQQEKLLSYESLRS